ncbi:MAG TPA: PorP/SprF family type IX secretion system membrane protein [Bacteroidales bacterium]|nr:PorP/SprF family type IX secretion system membrane protein [Bacteroidales bacterium]
MKRFLLLTVLIVSSLWASGQDIHFSQFNNAPLSLNPALAGAFSADHRIIANYKSQWRSISKSYLTYGISYDCGILKGKLKGGILGIGIQLFNDQAGDNKLNQTMVNISIAYHLPLNKHNMLTAGIQGGMAQKRIKMDNMRWDSQYDPAFTDGYNPSLPTGETMDFNKMLYGDIGAGLTWTYNSNSTTLSANDAKKVCVGISMMHMNRPRQTFSELNSNRMSMKMTLHANAFIGFSNTNFSLLPTAAWFMQGPANEIIFGSLFRYRLNDASKYTNFVSETAIGLGVYYRMKDACVVSAQMEWRNFLFSLSYDINTSKLAAASKSAGGLEVAFRYITPLFTKTSKSLF